MNNAARGMGLALACGLALVGCATPGGYGGYGGSPYGGAPGYPSGSPAYADQYQGTVEGVDPNAMRILLMLDDPRTGRIQRVEARYDRQTRLYYQGRESDVAGLERGDVIRFDATPSGSDLWIRQIEVVRNVRTDGTGGVYGNSYGDPYGAPGGGDVYGATRELSGTVGGVDTRSSTIRLDGTREGSVSVLYDSQTRVEYQGRSYRPENLDRGDWVRVWVRAVSGNRWVAERVIVERSVR